MSNTAATKPDASSLSERRAPFQRGSKKPLTRQMTMGSSHDDDGSRSAAAAGGNHGHHAPAPWGRGIWHDAQSTVAKHWKAEMTNFNFKTIGVSLFLFIAVIAPSITFGAVYAKRTNNYMGAVELLLATAWCGVFYSLVAGMPMMINGGTGPVLTFQAVTYELSKKIDVPFLTFNAWIGLWVAFYMLLSAYMDLNRFIQYATRFTDEIFAFLIISIFILDAIGNPASAVGLLHYFDPDHKHHDDMIKSLDDNNNMNDDYEFLNVAFLSLLLGLGTCGFALVLRGIKHSPFLCNDLTRSALTDFAITISVALFTVVKQVLFPGVPTEELNVPSRFAPTFQCCDASCQTYFPDDCPAQAEAYGRRPWLVALGDLNGKGWVVLAAAGPAALAFILAFLDNGITWHIINHPSNRLQHGSAYNYDTAVSAFMIAVNSLVGLPWLVASTVPCMMHVSAMSETAEGGNRVVSVQESRLTGFLTHCLVFGSLLALGAIQLIPLPVLYGVFLFMGVVALPAQQFWQRILLFFMQPNRYPKTPYTAFMENDRIHLYTMIQIGFFAALYAVKTIKTIAIAFPFFILLCIPARIYLLPILFDKFELIVLDGSPEEVECFVDALMDDGGEAGQQATDKLLPDDDHPKTEHDSGHDSDEQDNRGDHHSGTNDKDHPPSHEPVVDKDGPTTTTTTMMMPDNDGEPGAEITFVGDDDDDDDDVPHQITLGNHRYTPEMFESAARRAGRTIQRRKTVSDMSGMFRSPPETNWSHV